MEVCLIEARKPPVFDIYSISKTAYKMSHASKAVSQKLETKHNANNLFF
jgi:hypothetical protein